METVILVIHLLLAVALVISVLLQRSEGGALGMGGGGGGGGGAGGGGFMTGRSAANVLTRTTAILAACFMGTSIALSVLAGWSDQPTSIVDSVDGAAETAPADSGPAVPFSTN
jgi:preprotein translocase subunit SecG